MDRITHLPPLPPRPEDSHKGTFGHVLIVGGSESIVGAPAMAGTAAYRAGAGYVTVAMPRATLAAALTVMPELVGLPVGEPGDRETLMEAAGKADVVAVGPGLGQQAAAGEMLADLYRLAGKPMVVDADGLNLLAKGERWPADFAAAAVLTPHPGEMKRLGKLIGRSEVPTDEAGRIALAAEAAGAFGQVVVLKGHRTVVADAGGSRVYVNQTGGSSLAKAGSGDILTGIIAALLGQTDASGSLMNRFDAACLGVHLHGLAGERAGRAVGKRSVISRDIIGQIAGALTDYEAA